MNSSSLQDSVTPIFRRARLRALATEVRATLSKRWFLTFLRDSILFLALALAAVSLDSRRALWSLWWPMPLALAAFGLTMALHPAPILRWRGLGWLTILFILPLGFRALFSLHGPLPAEGLREAQELAVILFTSCSLWVLASSDPVRALRLWTGALLVGWAAGAMLIGKFFGNNPVLVATGLTVAWGALTAVWTFRPARSRNPLGLAGPPVRQPAPLPARFANLFGLAALGIGLCLGWACYLDQTDASLGSQLTLEAGLRAQGWLWMHSLLVGWGHTAQGRLIELLAEPQILDYLAQASPKSPAAAVPAWGSTISLLAMGGLIGLGWLVLWSIALFRRARKAFAERVPGSLTLLAVMAAMIFIGLMAAGGPHTAVVPFALAGWIALALASPAVATDVIAGRRQASLMARLFPALPVALAALILIVLFALPDWGKSILNHTSGQRLRPYRVQERLYRAQALNSYDPAIPMALAASFRADLTKEEAKSEMAYLRVVRLYQAAQALDPYDTIIPLRLAQFQLQCDRQEEAIETVRKALDRRPNSLDLINWLYLVAVRFELNPLAGQMIERGLALAPMKPTWWQRQYELAARSGLGPLASQSLAAAMTANPETPALVRAAWKAAKADKAAQAIPSPDGKAPNS